MTPATIHARRAALLGRAMLWWALLGTLLLLARIVLAQDSTPPHLHLARLCFRESGWSAPDCAAIHRVLVRRAARVGVSWQEMADRYGARAAGSARAVAIASYPDGDVPGWGPRSNARWAELREHARRVVAGEVTAGCAPDHWGARSPQLPDLARAMRAIEAGRWRVVDCGRTGNAFYSEGKP